MLPSLLPPKKIEVMTKVLSQLPYDVLWKWDTDSLPGQSKNIRIAKWFPQPAILSKFVYFYIKITCLLQITPVKNKCFKCQRIAKMLCILFLYIKYKMREHIIKVIL